MHWVLFVFTESYLLGNKLHQCLTELWIECFFFPAWRIEEHFFGGSNFIHADLEMTQDSFGVILFCWLYVAVWSALSQSNWAQFTPIQWIEMPICYKPTGTLKAKRPTSQNWGNTPLEAEDILHTSLPMSPPPNKIILYVSLSLITSICPPPSCNQSVHWLWPFCYISPL